MEKRQPNPTFLGAVGKSLLGLVGLCLIWAAVQLDVHNALGRALIAPLASN